MLLDLIPGDQPGRFCPEAAQERHILPYQLFYPLRMGHGRITGIQRHECITASTLLINVASHGNDSRIRHQRKFSKAGKERAPTLDEIQLQGSTGAITPIGRNANDAPCP